ncbi:Chemotaxis protein CheX [Sulfidibacter corallicola]
MDPMSKLNVNPVLMNCVIEGTIAGLAMTGIRPEAIGVSRFTTASKELSVIVGLHGKRNGNMTLNLSKRTAMFLASELLGTQITEMNEETIDAICEVGNMVAGKFHTILHSTPWRFDGISLPAFIFGANYNLYHLKNIVTVSVTFEIREVSVVHMADKFFTSSISLLGQSPNAYPAR